MNILITGANGYIGQRLIPVLVEQGHQIYCCVRNRKRFDGMRIRYLSVRDFILRSGLCVYVRPWQRIYRMGRPGRRWQNYY